MRRAWFIRGTDAARAPDESRPVGSGLRGGFVADGQAAFGAGAFEAADVVVAEGAAGADLADAVPGEPGGAEEHVETEGDLGEAGCDVDVVLDGDGAEPPFEAV